MAPATETNKTIFIDGLPLDITKIQVQQYCGANVEVNKNGQPMVYIYERKLDRKTASARVVFTSHADAQNFLSLKNKKKFTNSDKILHLRWYEERKTKPQKTNVVENAVIVDGLPEDWSVPGLGVYFQGEVGGVKFIDGEPAIQILEVKSGKQKIRVSFQTIEEARVCRLMLDGQPFKPNAQCILSIVLEDHQKPIQSQPPGKELAKKKKEPTPRATTGNINQPNGDNSYTAVHISSLPQGVDVAAIFFFFNEHVTGISRFDNFVPKIKILSREQEKVSAVMTFDSAEAAMYCVRNMNGNMFKSGELQSRLRLRPFYEKPGNNSKVAKVVTLDDLPGPHVPETRKPTNNTSLVVEHRARLEERAHSSKTVPTPLRDINLQEASKVLIQGLPKDSTESTLGNFISEPIARDANGIPMITLLKPRPKFVTRAALVTFTDPVVANRFIQKWDGQVLPDTDNKLSVRLNQDPPKRKQNEHKEKEKPKLADVPAADPKRIVWNVVFISGLPKVITQEKVKEVFKKYGEVRRVNLFEDENKQQKGCGTVSFANMGSAERCINAMNKTVFPGAERPMKVKFFEASKPRAERGGVDPYVRGTRNANAKTKEIKQGKAFDCIVCFDTCDENEMIGCVPITKDFDQDTHYICRECACRHAEALITDGEIGNGGAGLPCCTNGCSRVILRAHIINLVDNRTARLLDKRMTSVALLGIEGIEYCKRCEYGELIEANTIQIQYFKCQNDKCKITFCRICKTDYHKHIGKKCDDVDPQRIRNRARLQREEELSAAVIRVCPTCKTQFQKLDGCNKMVCQTCKTTMCYLCRETGITYDHFRNGGRCGQDTDSNAYDEARLREVRQKHLGTGTTHARYQPHNATYQNPAPRVDRGPYAYDIPRAQPQPYRPPEPQPRPYGFMGVAQPAPPPRDNGGCVIS